MTKLVGEKVRMRIWSGEGDRYGDELLYEALARLFRKEGFAGASVIRGIAGYGARGGTHGNPGTDRTGGDAGGRMRRSGASATSENDNP